MEADVVQRDFIVQVVQHPVADPAGLSEVVVTPGQAQVGQFEMRPPAALARPVNLLDAVEHGLQLASGELAVEIGIERFQRNAENVHDLEQFVDCFRPDGKGRLVEIAQTGLTGEACRIHDELVPDHWIVVGPRQNADAVPHGVVDNLLRRVVGDVRLAYQSRLAGLPVLAEVALEHATDVAQRQDRRAGGVMVDGLGLNPLFRHRHRFAVIQRQELPVAVVTYATEAEAALGDTALARRQVAFDTAVGQRLPQAGGVHAVPQGGGQSMKLVGHRYRDSISFP